jgi:hypothetical protein
MKLKLRVGVLFTMLGISIGVAHASRDSDTVKLFRNSSQSSEFFQNSYGSEILLPWRASELDSAHVALLR